MATSFGALCTDFYVNQKLAVKMDLPSEREASLHFFERIRQQLPAMSRFRRYDGELALESARRKDDPRYQWLALRRNSIRSGHVNPDTMQQALDFHKFILQQVPYHLSISPLDVDYVELTYGFDLECDNNHDEVVYNALFADTPLGKVMDVDGGRVLDCQPFVSVNLNDSGDLQAYFEVKTRQKSRRGSAGRYRDEPISVFLTVRKYGPVDTIDHLQSYLPELAEHCGQLAIDKLVPELLTPISRCITSSAG
ncbi:MAG: hypothetical protein ACE37H_06460 [Phycisphaeraceae bacterium]